MSVVWVVCPSARPVGEVAKWAAAWRERGYKIALFADAGTEADVERMRLAEVCHQGGYRGYATAVNHLVSFVMRIDPETEWFIAAGDDVFPDPNHTAEEIAAECRAHFNGGFVRRFPGTDGVVTLDTAEALNTFGVMQPTGDRFGEERQSHPLKGAYIDRVAGSAWIGREFAKRVNRGKGPLWPEYFHMGVDEELQEVAMRLGVFWQRPDLIHHHQHWSRRERGGPAVKRPAFLERASSPEEWEAYKQHFGARKAAGFPGSELV